eukprot:112102-Rhodomonas_salina.1
MPFASLAKACLWVDFELEIHHAEVEVDFELGGECPTSLWGGFQTWRHMERDMERRGRHADTWRDLARLGDRQETLRDREGGRGGSEGGREEGGRECTENLVLSSRAMRIGGVGYTGSSTYTATAR